MALLSRAQFLQIVGDAGPREQRVWPHYKVWAGHRADNRFMLDTFYSINAMHPPLAGLAAVGLRNSTAKPLLSNRK